MLFYLNVLANLKVLCGFFWVLEKCALLSRFPHPSPFSLLVTRPVLKSKSHDQLFQEAYYCCHITSILSNLDTSLGHPVQVIPECPSQRELTVLSSHQSHGRSTFKLVKYLIEVFHLEFERNQVTSQLELNPLLQHCVLEWNKWSVIELLR